MRQAKEAVQFVDEFLRNIDCEAEARSAIWEEFNTEVTHRNKLKMAGKL